MKWTIGNKISGLVVFSTAIFLILGIISFQTITKLILSVDWNTHTYKVLQKQELILSTLKDAETGQRGFIITGEEKYLEPFSLAVKSINHEIKNVIELTKDNPKQQQSLSKLKLLVDDKFAELNQTIDIRKKNGFEASLKIIQSDKGKKIMDDIRIVNDEIIKEENELLGNRELIMLNNAATSKSIIIYGISLSIIIIFIVGFFVIRNISRPLNEITDIAACISKGDLNVELSITKRKDEIGVLSQTFSRMIDKLKIMATAAQKIASGDLTVSIVPQSEKDILENNFLQMLNNMRRVTKEIFESVNMLGSSTSEILASTTQVASGSSETASSISETTSTVEEVRQAAQLSSQKASHVSESAQQVAEVTKTGQKAVDSTINGMNDIKNQMETIAETIVRLSEQSQQIGGIIASVNDVADQSNLLAVNASIEASKAGEQGKGFMVVAQEIKNLALQSKQATMQVRNILSDIQKATSAAVMATEQGSKAVENGVKQSSQAGEAIKKLSESSSKALEVSTQIVASSQQQVVGMDQIGQAMQNINQASTQNTASMQQAEKAAKDMYELGQSLKRVVEQYRL